MNLIWQNGMLIKSLILLYLLLQDKLEEVATDLLKVKTGGVAFSNLQALAQAMVDAY